MSRITVPIGHIWFEYGDDGKAPDPEQWLRQVIEQAEYVLELLPELEAKATAQNQAWPANIGKDCRVARQSAQGALQAISDDDPNTAMLAIFHAGRAIEKAIQGLAVFGGLRYRAGRAKQSRAAAAKGGSKPNPKRKQNLSIMKRVFNEVLTPGEQQGHITRAEWCAKYKKLAGEPVSLETMSGYLKGLKYPYTGKREKKAKSK